MAARRGVQPGFLRNLNERAVYLVVRESSPITGAAIARATTLSKPTVSTVLRGLVASGLVVESGQRPAAGPGTWYEPVSAAALAVGVEVQRTAVRAALTDLTGVELDRVVVDGAHRDADEVYASIEAAVAALVPTRRRRLLRSVVVGAPGIIDPQTGVLSNSGVVPALDGSCPADQLAARLGTPVGVVNDVDLAALGEQAIGCGRGVRHFAVVHIGEGMGAALVLDGNLYRGAHGGAGEIDDIPFRRLVASDPPISPALDGLVGLAERHAARFPDSVLHPPYTPAALFHAVAVGDPLAELVLDQLAEWASWFVAAVTAVIDPESIVLAGSIGARPELAERLVDSLHVRRPVAPQIVVSTLGDGSVLAGAIAVASAEALARRLDDLGARSA